jgi:drug/metabolite transporter (DMT)-like permease
VQSRRLPVLWVVLLSQACGLVLVLIVLAVRGTGAPALHHLLPALAAGVAGLLGLAAFYRGLAVGTMSIVAPIAAAGMALPVVVGIAGGDRPGPVRLTGMVVAGAGIILASREGAAPGAASRAARTSVILALLAALGFGAFALGLRSSARSDVVWALLAARVGCLLPLAAVLALGARIGAPERPRLIRLGPIALVGLLDVSANGLFALATRHGLLSVVAVGSSLYPLVTVLLARALLGERVRPSQNAGVLAALAGIVLIAAG